jgi:hypothetical protein
MTRTAWVLGLALIAAPACKRNAGSSAPAGSASPEVRHHGQGAEEAGLVAENDDDGGGAGGTPRHSDPMVYVDGETRASFTYNEMPSSVKVIDKGVSPDDEGLNIHSHHILVCDYFAGLGVDCGKVKMTHWYAGRGRIAMISGDELRRARKILFINFTKDFAGKPRVEWALASKIHTNDKPDIVNDLAIYLNKKPPAWSQEQLSLVDDKGQPIDGIPYAHEDGKRGVRINVDGHLVAKIKRNLLEGNVEPIAAPKPGEAPRYRVIDFLVSRGIKLEQVRGMDLIVREERVIRLSDDEIKGGLTFSAARQRHGEMMFYFGKHYVPVLAVDLWAQTNPPARPMRTVTLGAPTADRGEGPQAPIRQVQARR